MLIFIYIYVYKRLTELTKERTKNGEIQVVHLSNEFWDDGDRLIIKYWIDLTFYYADDDVYFILFIYFY